jgi:hypothetical protein
MSNNAQDDKYAQKYGHIDLTEDDRLKAERLFRRNRGLDTHPEAPGHIQSGGGLHRGAPPRLQKHKPSRNGY